VASSGAHTAEDLSLDPNPASASDIIDYKGKAPTTRTDSTDCLAQTPAASTVFVGSDFHYRYRVVKNQVHPYGAEPLCLVPLRATAAVVRKQQGALLPFQL